MPCVKSLKFQRLVFFVSNLLLKDIKKETCLILMSKGKERSFLSNGSQNILKEYSHVLKNEIVLTFVYVFSMHRWKSNNILKLRKFIKRLKV